MTDVTATPQDSAEYPISPNPTPRPFLIPRLRRLSPEERLIAALCMAFAVLLRFVHIAFRELFGDEFFTFNFVHGPRPPFIDSVFEGRMPLYYEFIRVWGGLVGTDGELMMRLPSAVFGLLTCVAFFFYAQRFLRGTAFAVGVLAICLNPVLVSVSNEALPYALVGLLAVLSNYFCVVALNKGGSHNWVGYAVASTLGALSHPLFWFLILGQFIFAVARPRKTPRPFLLVAAAGIFLLFVAMIGGGVYANARFPKVLDPEMPVIDDVARGLVAVLMGDFNRYWCKEFVQALLYLFVAVTLALSFYYSWMRKEEAKALPDDVVFIDDTQDVVGRWERLSLASFLAYQWATFAIPALCIMMLGSFAPRLDLHPELFVVCLPSLVFLVAAGVDAAPGMIGKIALISVFVAAMGLYNVQALTDHGNGMERLFDHLKSEHFDSQRDVLLLIHARGLDDSVKRYSRGMPSVQFPRKETRAETYQRLQNATAGKERVFVFYRDDYRTEGKAGRSSPARQWFAMRPDKWVENDNWRLAGAEKTELRIYIHPPADSAKTELDKPGPAKAGAEQAGPATPAGAPDAEAPKADAPKADAQK